jgi:hypothetical protein
MNLINSQYDSVFQLIDAKSTSVGGQKASVKLTKSNRLVKVDTKLILGQKGQKFSINIDFQSVFSSVLVH